MKGAFVAGCLAMVFLNCTAQTEEPLAKKYNHYIGVQANQLLKQLVNLNNSNSVIDDPYLLTYAIHMVKNGWGLQTGLGYDYQDIKDKTPISRETKINNLFYRIGVAKKFRIGKRFEGGYGLDLAGDYQINKTFASSVTVIGITIDSSSSNSTSKVNSFGFGPQVNLSYYFSERIMLGTEATYYFIDSKQKQNVLVTDNLFNQSTGINTVATSNSNIESSTAKFSLSIPVALFLIVRF